MKRLQKVMGLGVLAICLCSCADTSVEEVLTENGWTAEDARWVKTEMAEPFINTTACQVEHVETPVAFTLDPTAYTFTYRVECPSETMHEYPESKLNQGTYYEEFVLNYEEKTLTRTKNLSSFLFYPEANTEYVSETDVIETVSVNETGEPIFICFYHYEDGRYVVDCN